MGLLGRRPERAPGRFLVASGAKVDLSDKKVALRSRKYRQSWQDEAWSAHGAVGELGYAHRFLGNAASRMHLFAAARDPEAPKAPPAPIDTAKGVDKKLAAAAQAAMDRLGMGRQATAALLKATSVNFSVPGECNLLGRVDPERGEVWEIRSNDELVPGNDGFRLRELPTDYADGQVLSDKPLDPENTYLSRLWVPDSRFRALADSPMRQLIETCDELLLLSRGIRAAAKSRMAANGFFYIPDEMSLMQDDESDDNPNADPFMTVFTQAVTAPILDEQAPSAVVPIVIRGPADLAEALRHIPIDRLVDKTAMDTRNELIRRIATGLDLPPEILLGVADVNHWASFQIDDSTFRHHIEPQVLAIVDALTAGYLWPSLAADGFKPEEYRAVSIWYDPTELVTHPDRTADALQLWDRNAISDETLRAAAGFTDADKPDGIEVVQRMMSHVRTYPPNVVEAVIHRTDPTLEIPPDAAESGYGPGGELEPAVSGATAQPDPNAPATAAEQAGAPPRPDAKTPTRQVPKQSGKPSGRPARAAATVHALTAASSPPGQHRAGAALGRADRDLMIRLHTAAETAMRRELERAGARVRTKTRGNLVHAAAIRNVDNALVCATLGRAAVVAAGDVQAPSWADLRGHWREWLAGIGVFAQTQVSRLVADLCRSRLSRRGRCTLTDADLEGLARQRADHENAAWSWFEERLGERYDRLLYTSNPDGSGDVSGSLVPMRLVRGALALAGGFGADPTSAGLGSDGRPADPSEPMGGVATGADTLNVLSGFGVVPSGWQWVHGSPQHPFEPHEELDGVVVSGLDDSRLANNASWPDFGEWFPGDHDACSCAIVPCYVTSISEDAAA